MMKYERRLWERLIESLDRWTCAAEVEPGHIEVSLPSNEDPARRVLIVMTPDQWSQMVGVMWGGDLDDAVQDVKRTLRLLQPHEGFAVYSQYELEPSIGPSLPEPTYPAAEPGGEWVALDNEGRVVSRLADCSAADEPPE